MLKSKNIKYKYSVHAYCKSCPKKGKCSIPAGMAIIRRKIHSSVTSYVFRSVQRYSSLRSYLLNSLDSSNKRLRLKDPMPN